MPIYLQHGNLIDYVSPTDTSTEDVVFMGGLVGVPQTFIPAGELGALSVDGVYIFNKKDGVSVNLGDVVKYCGTTKLAQDRNADLTLGVAVADAEADDYGVKVKINSVLPTDGGGGGGSGEVAVSCGLTFNEQGELYVSVAYGCGISFNSDGQLVATGGGGGGGEVSIDTSRGLVNGANGLAVNIGDGLSFDCGGGIDISVCYASGLDYRGGSIFINYRSDGAITADRNGLYLKVCTASGLSIDSNGYLTYTG